FYFCTTYRLVCENHFIKLLFNTAHRTKGSCRILKNHSDLCTPQFSKLFFPLMHKLHSLIGNTAICYHTVPAKQSCNGLNQCTFPAARLSYNSQYFTRIYLECYI